MCWGVYRQHYVIKMMHVHPAQDLRDLWTAAKMVYCVSDTCDTARTHEIGAATLSCAALNTVLLGEM